MNLVQLPAYFEIYGELLDGTMSLLSSHHHALLWIKQRSPLRIVLPSTVVRSLVLIIYGLGVVMLLFVGTDFAGNDGHYYGRIVVSAETPVFCPAFGNVAKTAGGECVLEMIQDSSQKGYVKHCCRVEQEEEHKLHRWGVWNVTESHTVLQVPSPHKAFVEFMFSVTQIQPIIAEYQTPSDLETCLMVLLGAKVTVYSVSDISEAVCDCNPGDS